jgi:hypothetical protein
LPLSTGQKIKNRTAKLPETLAQYGLWMLCLKPLLGKHFKLFVLYLDIAYILHSAGLLGKKIFTTKE